MVQGKIEGSARSGIILAVGGYLIWGFCPIYFHYLQTVPTVFVLCHRVIWSFLIFALLLFLPGRREKARASLNLKSLAVFTLSASLLACNWFFFVYTVAIGQIMQAPLGYFILPLMTCALGMIFLKERLRKLQYISVAVAACGVGAMIVGMGQIPTIALILAVSFAGYGFVRKIAPVGALVGMAFEMAVMLPAALIIILTPAGRAASYPNNTILILLLCAGVITATPLLMFTTATRRLRLTSLSFCQYVGPTCQLSTALFYGEPFTRVHAISFGLIWVALGIYSFDSWRAGRNVVLTEAALEPE